MARITALRLGVALGAAALLAGAWSFLPPVQAETAARLLPVPALAAPASASGTETAVFAGGCFWGVQGVFQHVKGVTQAVSGYSGGTTANPSYEEVSSGRTGHAESVRVTFDPRQVSYARLLQIFFSTALDPTQVNSQGPDFGTQYRSVLFATNPDQERVARAYVAQLEAAHSFSRPIATQIVAAGPFYAAEGYHQDYLTQHPNAPYIAVHDMPKIKAVQTLFPNDWRNDPVPTGQLASGG